MKSLAAAAAATPDTTNTTDTTNNQQLSLQEQKALLAAAYPSANKMLFQTGNNGMHGKITYLLLILYIS